MRFKIPPVLNRTLCNSAPIALQPLIFLVLTPVYVRYLGLDCYGLVGLCAALAMVCSAFIRGITTTLFREVSLRVSDHASRPTLRRLHSTFEIVYWLAAIAIM